MGKPTDLVQGTVDLLILKTVALEPVHGWAIAQRIRQVSKNVLQVNQGALYPALHRLEQQGWIVAEWAESETGRQAKFYSLTSAGREQLEREIVVDRDALDEEPFRADGGFARLNRIFDGNMEAILGSIQEEVWRAAA